MSEEPHNCPDCCQELPSPDWEGPCPRCLLAEGLSDDDRAIATPVGSRPQPPAESRENASPASEPSDKPTSETGAAAYAPTLEEMADLFPEFETVSLLGAGGMGAVYQVRQPRLDRFAALKILGCPPEHREGFALRFEREAQVLAKLNHPNIVTIYDFGEREWKHYDQTWETLFFFLMEFVDGADLAQLIRTKELTPDQALGIVPKICEALQFAHDAGITHRDIKPANILLDQTGQVKIADFGLAKLIEGEQDAIATGLTLTGTSMGTPYYMAPEQFESPEKVDHRADIYSLGVVFYEMLTGDRPHGLFSPPSEKVGVDDRIDTVVLKAMEKEPDARYQQASEVSEDVTRVSAEPVPERKVRRDGGIGRWLSVATGLALLAGAAWWWMQGEGGDPSVPETVPDPPLVEAIKDDTNGPGARGNWQPLITHKLSTPGRLRVDFTGDFDNPIDISRVEQYDDIVQVRNHWHNWAVLRANGDVISTFSHLDGSKNVLWMPEAIRLLLTREGRLRWLDKSKPNPLPNEIDNYKIVDCDWNFDNDFHKGVAVAENGRAFVFGSAYEAADDESHVPWVKPDAAALQNVTAAVTTESVSFFLYADGKVSVWGRKGPREIHYPTPTTRFVALARKDLNTVHLEDDSGRIWWHFNNGKFGKIGEGKLLPGGEVIATPSGHLLSLMGTPQGETGQDLIDRNHLRAPTYVHGKVQYSSGDASSVIYWIEPGDGDATEKADGEKPDTKTVLDHPTSGRLRAAGTAPNGDPPDLSKVAGLDDLVDVGGRVGEWVVLRANGDTISSSGQADFEGIRRIGWSFAENFALIDTEGKIRFPENRALEVPAAFDDAVIDDVQLGNSHGIALIEDGRAFVFGKRYHEQVGDPTDGAWYGTPRWPEPPEEILEDVKDIAVTSTHAAVLQEDGTLSIFGWNGVRDLPQTKGFARIETIGSAPDRIYLLDPDGQVWKHELPRNPALDQPVLGGGEHFVKVETTEPAVTLKGECWQGESGQWHTESKAVDAILKREEIRTPRGVSIHHGIFSGQNYQSVLWIEDPSEPSGKATAASAFTGRLRAFGKLPQSGEKIDLTKAERISDFTQVVFTAESWVGLRENGTLVSSDGRGENAKNVRRLLPGFHYSFGYIDADGRLTFEGTPFTKQGERGVMEIPEEVQEIGVVDAAWGDGDAIALLRDGTVRVWGDHYEGEFKNQPQWPRPDTSLLRDVVQIAKTPSRAAVLQSDGSLHVWGFAGDQSVDLEKWKDLGKVADIASGWSHFLVRWDTGRVQTLGGGQTLTGAFEAQESDAIFQGLVRIGERWKLRPEVEEITPAMADALSRLEGLRPGQFAVHSARSAEKFSAIWIEPNSAREPEEEAGSGD